MVKMNDATIIDIAINQWFMFLISILTIIGIVFVIRYLMRKRIRDDKMSKIDLYNHNLFWNLYNLINMDLDNLNIKKNNKFDINRDNIASDFLKIKFYVFKIWLKEFIIENKNNIDSWTNSQIYNKLKIMMTDLIKKYENIAYKMKIPEIFIRWFKNWHEERITLILKFVDIISESDVYLNDLKIHILFDKLIVEFYGTIYDAKHTLNNINWELDWVKYKKQLKSYDNIKNIYLKFK